MKKIVYISDFFIEHNLGGAEICDEVIIKKLSSEFSIEKVQSKNLNITKVLSNKDAFFIISNFSAVHPSVIDAFFSNKLDYIIYEHDHKYLITRNPAIFPNYIAPKNQIINESFYTKAVAVLCQSIFHKNIIKNNLENVNLINLGGNIWPVNTLNMLENLCNNSKEDTCAIMESNNWHKNTAGAIKYCEVKNLPYKLIPNLKYEDFLQELSKNKKLVFFPQTPETLSRLVVESRMLNLSVIINDKVGASYEDWFNIKGIELIKLMKDKRISITKTVQELM